VTQIADPPADTTNGETTIRRLIPVMSAYDKIDNVPQFITAMGAAIHQSGFFGCVNEAQGRVIALSCMIRKIDPLERASTDHIIEGKLSMRADAMLAGFMARGGKVKWIDQGDTGEKAVAKFTSRDNTTIEISYTIEMARTAGLIKDKPGSNWRKNPGEMLRARLISKAVRMIDPEVVAGRYTPEELDPDHQGDFAAAAYVPAANTENVKPLELPKTSPAPAPASAQPVTSSAVNVAAPVVTQTPPPVVTASATGTASGELSFTSPGPTVTREQLSLIKSLKDALGIGPEAWQKVLAKYNVTSAKNMSDRDAGTLITNMEHKKAARDLNNWANGVQTATAPASAQPVTSSAGVASEQPPFDTK